MLAGLVGTTVQDKEMEKVIMRAICEAGEIILILATLPLYLYTCYISRVKGVRLFVGHATWAEKFFSMTSLFLITK